MIALQIQDVKGLMSQLLVRTLFDEFLIHEMDIDTATSLHLDGRLNKSWYSSEETEELGGREYGKWSELKPVAYQYIKGNRTPLSMRIVFQLNRPLMEKLLLESGVKDRIEDVGGLYLNLRYDSNGLYLITGTSRKTFTLDKSLEHYWDESVKQFLHKAQIAYTEE